MTAFWRMIRKQPLVFFAAVFLVAFGVAGATSVICFVQAVNTRPPGGTTPPANVVFVSSTLVGGSSWMDSDEVPFDQVECWSSRSVLAKNTHGVVRAATLHPTTPGLLDLIGVAPTSGRLPSALPRSNGEPLEALISESFAKDLGGLEPLIVGDTVEINGEAILVVGVAESNFVGPTGEGSRRPLWVVDSNDAGAQCEVALGRLWDGISPDSAQHLLAGPGPSDGTLQVIPLAGILGHPKPGSLTNFYLRYGMSIMAAVLILLCVNLSVLYACILVARRREIAIRLGLGATDLEIGRQLLVEWLITVGIASGLGVLLYLFIVGRIDAGTPGLAVQFSLATGIGVAALTVLIGIVTGIAPARAVARMSPNEVLRADVSRERPSRSLQDRLMVAQVALATPVLIAVCIVAWQGLANRPDDGLDPARRSRMMDMSINWSEAGSDWQRTAERLDSIFSALTSSGAITGVVPLSSGYRERQLRGDHGEATVETRAYSPGRFALEGRQLLHGRDLVWADTVGGHNPVLISDRLAVQLFGTDDVVGREMYEDGLRASSPGTHQIIGVVAAREFMGIGDNTSLLYLRPGIKSWGEYRILGNAEAEKSLPQIQETFTRALPELTISVRTMDELRQSRSQSNLWLGTFSWGLAALCSGLAVAGFFAVTGLTVRMRWKEIAIRKALGANDWHLLFSFMLHAAISTARGIAYAAVPTALLVLLVGSQAFLWVAVSSAWVLSGILIILLAAVASGVAASRVVFMHPAEVLHHD